MNYVVVGPPNVLPFTRPRAFGFQQRDAKRRAETRRGSAGPPNGTRSGATAELGGSPRLQSPKLQLTAPLADSHEKRCCGEVQWRFLR